LPRIPKQVSILHFALTIFMLFAAGLAATVLSAPASGRPLVPAERQYLPYYDMVPPCDDPVVFARIQRRFFDREAEFWNSGLEILGFERVSEIGYKTNGLDYIPRRYCSAWAYFNDAKWRSVFYSLDEDLGIIGYGFGVTWCVEGLDRNDTFAPHCKMVRP
jgi:hypothetical protein